MYSYFFLKFQEKLTISTFIVRSLFYIAFFLWTKPRYRIMVPIIQACVVVIQFLPKVPGGAHIASKGRLFSALIILIFFVPYVASGLAAIGKLFNSLSPGRPGRSPRSSSWTGGQSSRR